MRKLAGVERPPPVEDPTKWQAGAIMSKRRLSGIPLPPPPRNGAKVFDVGVWLLRVLDHRDPAFEMVLQMTSYQSKFGSLSDKQRNALYAVARDAANVMQMQFDETEQPDEFRRGLRVVK